MECLHEMDFPTNAGLESSQPHEGLPVVETEKQPTAKIFDDDRTSGQTIATPSARRELCEEDDENKQENLACPVGLCEKEYIDIIGKAKDGDLSKPSSDISISNIPIQTRKRQRSLSTNASSTDAINLSFGYFTGTQIFRNQLGPHELLEDGHVSLQHLIPPKCHLALLTTFECPNLIWMEQTLSQIDQVILVAHSGPDLISNGLVIGQSQAQPLKHRPNWFWIAVKPHIGLMHAKVLLLRCPEGLRVVVSGNNLTQNQWTRERDCLWVQDFPLIVHEHLEYDGCSDDHMAEDTEFSRLRSFIEELTQSPFHDNLIPPIIDRLFENVDGRVLVGARFVYSFPRQEVAVGRRPDRGGWQQLAQVMARFRKKAGYVRSLATFEKDIRDLENLHVYAMSGSMGDLTPDFLTQMRHAMGGNVIVPPTKEWNKIRRTYILWPSQETVRAMNPFSVMGSARPMALSHWNSIPIEDRRHIFFDALPCPSRKAFTNYHAFAHCKVICAEQEGSWGSVYIGSHNFSKAAWGINNTMPKNIEFGVVLFTQSKVMWNQWKSRLPYHLPPKNSVSPQHYEMGRASDTDNPMFQETIPGNG